MANLLTDDAGLPIPQYMDSTSGTFAAMRGTNGAIYTSDINFPSDGIHKVKIYGSDGNVLNVTSNGVPVACNQHAVNNYEYDTTTATWVPKTKGVLQKTVGLNTNIIPSAARTASVSSSIILNEMGARNAFILLDVTATSGTITGIEIKIPITGTNVLYKTIALGSAISTVGKSIITFGLDDETNKVVIPQTFTIDLVHGDTNSITYSVDIQLS